MYSQYRWLVLPFWFLAFHFLEAQDYKIREIPINNNGESHKIRNKIYIDEDGILWYSTFNGIVKEFETNSVLSTFLDKDEKILSTYLDVIFMDSKHRIWIVSDIGVFISDSLDDSFDRVHFKRILDEEKVSLGSLIEDCNGNIWAGTYNDRILKIDPSLRVTKYKTPKADRNLNPGYFQRSFSFVEKVIDCDKILFRLGRKLYLLEEGNSTLYTDLTTSLNYTKSSYLYPEWSFNGGDGLLITDNGALFPESKDTDYQFEGEIFETQYVEDLGIQVTNLPFQEMIPIYKSNTPYLKNHADLIAIDGSGKKLGFYKLQQRNGQDHLTKAHEISFPYMIDDVVVDNFGVIYVSSYDRIRKIKFNSHTFHKILEDYGERKVSARGFLELPNTEILAASYLGTFKLSTSVNDFRESTYSTEMVFPTLNYLRSFLPISDSTAWCVGEHKKISHINFLENEIIGEYLFEGHPRLTHMQYYDVAKYSDSTLLIASNFGLQEFDTYRKQFLELPILPLDNNDEVFVRDLLRTKGKLYVATDRNGLFIQDLTSQTFQTLKRDDAKSTLRIPTNKIYVVFVDQGENLWIGTNIGVVYVDKDLKKMKVIGKADGLTDLNVVGILEDADGIMWFSTYYGLFRYDRSSKEVASFFVEDGLAFNDFNQNSYYRSSKDRLFFGGINGIIAFDSINIPHQSRDIKIFPTKFEYYDRTKGREVGIDVFNDSIPSFNLPYYKNSFSTSYGINDNFNTDYNRYFYKLEGFADEWISLGNQTTLKLFSIPPGNYGLKIKGFNATGVESSNELSYTLNVSQVFYKRLWFQFLAIFFLIGTFVVWLVSYITKERKKNALNLTLIELERNALRAQMSPHFIFNSLSGIRLKLKEKGLLDLHNYISNFSNLMRLTLDVTRHKNITLAKEMEYIKNYVALINSQNEHTIELHMKCMSDIDIHGTYIPPMILQPIIENSIVHGFMKDQENKVIVVDIKKSPIGKQIVVVIEDNGLGISQTRKKQNIAQKHQSYATQILYERLMLMNKTHYYGESKYEIAMKDLSDKGAQGTRVTIGIPYY
ncbi:histidine kinase [Ulvibacterium sp.]|uniref:sensor histidine kinase n=1 Tax=Ulvibacterium sp. TaxID=2665914 RepID=UPI003CC64BE9